MNIIQPSATELAQFLGGHRAGRDFVAHCPAHDDKTPSLAISDGNGKLLLHCHAGCNYNQISQALHSRGVSLNKPSAVRTHANSGAPRHGVAVTRYDYTDADGILVYRVCRDASKNFWAESPDGSGGWREGMRNVDRVLYRAKELFESTALAETIFVVEGEKDADNLAHLGLTATTNPFGANAKWEPQYTDALKGAPVIIIPDNDEPGRKHALKIAAALSAEGISVKIVPLPDLPEKGDVSDWLDSGGTKERLTALIAETSFWEGESDILFQADPILFGATSTPDISSDLLPSWLGEYTRALGSATQTPSALSVMLSLAVVATCLQRKFEVSPFKGYSEPLSLYTVVALPPASRKTAVIKALTSPLIEWEREQAQALQRQIAEEKAERVVLNEQLKELQRQASKEKDPHKLIVIKEDCADIQQKLDTPITKEPRLWTGDVTPEQLQNMLHEHGGAMAILSDEGGIFDVMSGLYSDGKSNFDVFLQGHAGAPLRIDRGSRTVYVDRPALSIGLAVQPGTIEELSRGSKKRLRGRGGLARILYALPESNIGARDFSRHDPIPAEAQLKYEQNIKRLLELKPALVNGLATPHQLSLSAASLKSWQSFAQEIESQQGTGKRFEPIQDWTGKLPGAALRIAGLFHIVEGNDVSLPIDASTMHRAIELSRVLIQHAEAAFDLMTDTEEMQDARYVLAYVVSQKATLVKQNALHRLGRFSRHNAQRLIAAVQVLIERNILSPRQELPTKKPTYVYYVHPALFTMLNSAD